MAMMSGTPAFTPMPLRPQSRPQRAELPATIGGMKCEHSARAPEAPDAATRRAGGSVGSGLLRGVISRYRWHCSAPLAGHARPSAHRCHIRVHRCPTLVVGMYERFGHLCAVQEATKGISIPARNHRVRSSLQEPRGLERTALVVKPCSRAMRLTSAAGTGPLDNTACRNSVASALAVRVSVPAASAANASFAVMVTGWASHTTLEAEDAIANEALL